MATAALVLLPLVWVTVLAVCGAYRTRQPVRGEFRRVVTGIVAVLAVVSSALLATAFPASRGAVGLALLTAAAGVLCGRTACRVGGWYGRIRPARR
ncbi:hypothetical protein [Actinocatenispora rupis]|uniref:Transmembrane protein n=1 Tax=Actinocatenispora rupis TaxID=519421 RepID=A0A8J3JA18_9ACTN|nr:hypothetical protein [Actinocatenispora rupis]GID14627.1 hypothetical protein Aru02nite_55160 [Actinocatenispora rupis]